MDMVQASRVKYMILLMRLQERRVLCQLSQATLIKSVDSLTRYMSKHRRIVLKAFITRTKIRTYLRKTSYMFIYASRSKASNHLQLGRVDDQGVVGKSELFLLWFALNKKKVDTGAFILSHLNAASKTPKEI